MATTPTAEPLYLCLDQGGHSSRALVFDRQGRQIATARQPLTASRCDDTRAEYPAAALVDSLQRCLQDALQQLGTARRRLAAAALATQRSNVACWNRADGTPLSPVISWQDRRHARWLEQFADRADWIHQRTGLALSPHYGASKLRWCLDNLPAVQQAQRDGHLMLGPMAAWLARQLTREAEARADPVNASRTQLWSLQARDWDPDLLALFGIPRPLLPPCVPNLTGYGQLAGADVALPLKLVNGDQAAALYAYGPLRRDTAYINLGTGAFVSRATGAQPLPDAGLLSSLVLQEAEHCEYVLEGTVNGAGSALDWLARQQDRDPFPPEQLAAWLNTPQASLPLFLNGVSGLGAPYWRADFASRFIGEGEPDQQALAVLESILFLLQINLARMHRQLAPARRLQLTGGLANLDGLCQRLADLSRIPVYRPAECEATARGSAFLLAGQPADWPEPGPGREFEPQENPALQQRYTSWQEAMEKALGRGG
ncbi:FGGY family carbohydrate kinase [Thiohalophilus thiocyanatoxydans]|uniref:Glycerol kinase n=1 Tax=Thiohalophilus thiocyanatoxydans TaxID=381308 RepID=A0A4R8ITI6_9GAMM|nr:FGGY family carbohydrate kinase [Thiohalophilus thiocyanatoxydans]TDY00987.1 glycerol kinase [Thiohalophilus thiocyanatoxydans]